MGFRVLDATVVLLFVDRFEVSSEYGWGSFFFAQVAQSHCRCPV